MEMDTNVEHTFDKAYWEQRWKGTPPTSPGINPPHPALMRELAHLPLGTALDAGCGAGAEAAWLATAGWQVTAVDISRQALERAAAHAEAQGGAERIRWIEADLSVWQPATPFDLVTAFYAHPAMPQLDFYTRIADWVKPGGTLLLVGHLHAHGVTGHEHQPLAAASVTAAAIRERLGDSKWRIETTAEQTRLMIGPTGQQRELHDVVVRATRLG